jgi:hypothetical protein
MNSTKILSDNMSTMETKALTSHDNPYFRTQVIAGYDPYIDEKGVTRFGEEIFNEENMLLIGGSVFTLEKLFNTRVNSELHISQLRDVFGSEIPHPVGWGTASTDNHPADNAVCLFGVGIGGAGDTIADIKDVKYYQRNVDKMVPLRVVSSDADLTAAEHDIYYCRSVDDSTNPTLISYYLKKFDNVSIQCRWRDSENEAEGSNVTSEYFNTSPQTTTPIETYVELTLKISKDDIREYFELNDNIEKARLNTIGLYSAVPVTLDEPIPVEYDAASGGTYHRTTEYDQVVCFSCLNFDNEMLTLPKELTIVYRIFTK